MSKIWRSEASKPQIGTHVYSGWYYPESGGIRNDVSISMPSKIFEMPPLLSQACHMVICVRWYNDKSVLQKLKAHEMCSWWRASRDSLSIMRLRMSTNGHIQIRIEVTEDKRMLPWWLVPAWIADGVPTTERCFVVLTSAIDWQINLKLCQFWRWSDRVIQILGGGLGRRRQRQMGVRR